jgi:transcription termination factor Rho
MADIVTGVLKRMRQGGVLRDPKRSFRSTPKDAAVPPKLIQQFMIPEGAAITGPATRGKHGYELQSIETICGLPPEDFAERALFDDLVAIDPNERFHLGAAGNISMRIVDLISPIGKGTRSLIVSPPKAGKTIILEQLATAIHADDPETRILCLLIDERPEEVTSFRRNAPAEVLASSNDQTIPQHIELAELTLAHCRVELECGRDVVVLVDSLTRMGRAFNQRGGGSGRTMSGGLEAGALEIPRRFFGLARNIENGGSVTIIATCLVDTGSRMDQLIFEEFKGTGNSEIILDRQLAEQRIWPAINIPASGTRKEERLYTEDEIKRISKMRRALAGHKPHEAVSTLLTWLSKHPNNEAFLKAIPAT